MEVLEIVAAIISTDEATLNAKADTFNINDELVSSLKAIRGTHAPTQHPDISYIYDPVIDENSKIIAKQQEEIKHICREQAEHFAAFDSARKSFNDQIELYQRENDDLKEANTKQNKKVQSLFRKADKQEQYSRRHILEAENIPYKKGENTTDVVIEIFRAMGVRVSHCDICRSHRNGRKRNGPRPIFVKFVRHDLRDEVYNNRDNLRDIPRYSRVFINENLTKYRSDIYREVRRERDFFHWTYDGTIYVQKKNIENARIFKIVSQDDYEWVFRKPFPVTTSH